MDPYGKKILSIFDMADPENPAIINTVYFQGPMPTVVALSNGYAYIIDGNTLEVLDVDPPESAHTINSLKFATQITDIVISGGYAYISSLADTGISQSPNAVNIVDIATPGSEKNIKTVDCPGDAIFHIAFKDGYAFLSDTATIFIFDVDPPVDAYLARIFGAPGVAQSVQVAGNYAYIADSLGFEVFDVSTPESADIIGEIILWDSGIQDLAVSNNVAYLGEDYSLYVIGIGQPQNPHVINAVDIPGDITGISVSDGNAYVIYGISLPDELIITLGIVDVDPVEEAHIIKDCLLYTTSPGVLSPEKVEASAGYAYISCATSGFYVVDVDPPEAVHVVKTIPTEGKVSDIKVYDGYALVRVGSSGLAIFDLTSPATPEIIDTIAFGGSGGHIAVSDGYAYAYGYVNNGTLYMIDIDPIINAHISASYGLPLCGDISVSDGYAYLANGAEGLRIIKLW